MKRSASFVGLSFAALLLAAVLIGHQTVSTIAYVDGFTAAQGLEEVKPSVSRQGAVLGKTLAAAKKAAAVSAKPQPKPAASFLDQALINTLIQQQLTDWQLSGRLQGPKGDKGDQGPSGAPGFFPFFIPANPSSNFSGSTLLSATDLSGTNLLGTKLTVSESATFQGSFTVAGASSLATTTISNLTVSRDLTVEGSLTVHGSQNLSGALGATYFTTSSSTATSTFTGAVGIGTTAPVTKLDVWGSLNVATGSTPALFVNTANGRVGIGTANPGAYLLDVNGAINSTAVTANNFSAGNSYTLYTGGLYAGSVNRALITTGTQTPLGARPWRIQSGSASLSDGYITLETAGLERLRVDQYGNVGIGTTGPGSLLSLQGTSTNPTLPLLTIASSSGSTLLTVLPNGNVGIGKANPANALDITGDAAISSQLLVGSHIRMTNNSALLWFRNGGNNYIYSPAANKLSLMANEVGIGTTTPIAALSLNASTTAAGGINFGDATANLYRNAAGGLTSDSGLAIGSHLTLNNSAAVRLRAGNSDISSPETGKFYFSDSTMSGNGIVVAGTVGIGTTTPADRLQVMGNIQIGSVATTTAYGLLFNSGSGYQVALKATTTLGSSYTLTLPTTTPVANNLIMTDANGNLSWIATSSLGIVSGASASGTAGNIQFAGAGNTLDATALFTWDNSNSRLSIGTTSNVSAITLAQGTTAAGGINFGDATANLYRSATGTLKSDAATFTAPATIVSNNTTLALVGNTGPGVSGEDVVIRTNTSKGPTSGTGKILSVKNSSYFNPVSGNAKQHTVEIGGTINQLNTASGITRGLYFNPTLTSVADWRTLEIPAMNATISTSSTLSIAYNTLINAVTYTSASSSGYTLANASTLNIAGAPGGTSASTTISSSTALSIQGNALTNVTDAYGLFLQAPTGAANNYAAVFNGGNVGIGTTSPAQLLHVYRATDGDVAAFTDSNGTCTINPTSTALVCSSDARLKKDVEGIESALDKISKLRSVSFHWLNQSDDTKHFGYLAQEIEQIIPEVVATDANGYKSVAYSNLIPLLTRAIQEQQEQINSLQGGLTGSVQVNALTVSQPVVYEQGIMVKQHLYLSEDSVGQAKVLIGQTSVRVTFQHPYQHQPIVTVTPLDFVEGQNRVTAVDATGFTIELKDIQTGDVTFNWHSFAGAEAKLSVSDGTSQDIVLIVPEPVVQQIVEPAGDNISASSTPSEGAEIAPTSTPLTAAE